MPRTPKILLTDLAVQDLQEIKDYIARDNRSAARRVVREMKAAMHRLAEMPGTGHARSDLTDEDVLFWPIYSYLIVYRPETKPLEIVTVISGHRDVGALLERRLPPPE